MVDANEEVYEFADFRLDVRERILWCQGTQVRLPARAFGILFALVRRRNCLVSKEELLEEVWSDATVEQNNLDKNISILRKSLDEQIGRRFIETVRGHGYRFLIPVSVVESMASISTIAILPFKPLIADRRDEALELGIIDSLITCLSGGDVTVRQLSAVRRYGSLDQDPIEAGRELGVEAVLDGSVNSSGERLRISVRLFRISNGKVLWAEQFDERAVDVFALQDLISDRLATTLKAKFGAPRKKRLTENIQAYQLYARGRYHVLKSTPVEMLKGIDFYKKAIDVDSSYALAHASLGYALVMLPMTCDVPPLDVVPQAKIAAQKALALDDSLGEPYQTLGWASFWFDYDWDNSEREFRRALQLDPENSLSYFGYAHLLSILGRHDESLMQMRKGRESEPLSLVINALEGLFLFYAGKHEEAISSLTDVFEIEPDYWIAHINLGKIYIDQERYEEAIKHLDLARQFSGDNTETSSLAAFARAKSGEHSWAFVALEQLRTRRRQSYVSPYNIAIIYNALDQTQPALDWLELAYNERDVRLPFIKVDPKWNGFRREPRFIKLMNRMNL
jgi:DNA-binding winged helix-turn-helix (wHTH) protein/Flp pilus assembly protein TadD